MHKGVEMSNFPSITNMEGYTFSKENPIKLGIDVHGVMDDDPDSIKRALEACINTGFYEVHVISGPPAGQVQAELETLSYQEGVHYQKLHTIVDFLKESDAEMWLDDKKTWWASDEDWWSAKAKICEKYGIDIMIDNTTHYEPYFKNTKTKFWLYARKEKVNTIKGSTSSLP